MWNHRRCSIPLAGLLISATCAASADWYYTQRLEDPRAVYVASPTGTNDTGVLQQAINRVQETTGLGLVLVGPGRYTVTNTIYIWPSIRVIGYGASRPVIFLPADTPGFQDASAEKQLFFFAGGRPGFGRNGRRESFLSTRSGTLDANPGTFYSALANVDIEVEKGNSGAVAVRAKYAQHCFLAHMDMRLGSALSGIHEGGNVVEDVRFFGGRYGIWTSKPSPGWQFTVIDCSFEGQREAAILEREAGLTLIRPHFLRVPSAVMLEPEKADELWLKDARLEEISGPAFVFGVEKNPRNEINMEGISCRSVPLFASLRDSGQQFKGLGEQYVVKTFSHGLSYQNIAAQPEIRAVFEAEPVQALSAPVASDLPGLPPLSTFTSVRELGAKGDGTTDDTEVFQKAILEHRSLYIPSGFYVLHDTLKLRPDTVLLGLHPGATQLILPDNTLAFQNTNSPKALLETPSGGSNIVCGIGLYTSGANPAAVAALWRAGANSLMNDVRFLGGHGTPKPDGTRESPYNSDHSADPNPNRQWDSQYPSLWVCDNGGGTFLDIWTPSTFAKAGMLVSDTETEGRVYQMSSEHHVHNEVRLRNAAHWKLYALQTEAERGESGVDLPLDLESCRDITIANFHVYRVISMFQPFRWAASVSKCRDIHFRNFHCYSNSKVSYDASVHDQTAQVELRQREFAWLNISGEVDSAARRPGPAPVVERGAAVEKLAGGFFNISGGVAGPNGEFYFVDARPQRIYRWDTASRSVSTLSEGQLEPVNVAADQSGNLLVVSYAGRGTVYSIKPGSPAEQLKSITTTNEAGKTFFLPVSDWRVNRESLSHPVAHFISPDGNAVLPVGIDFLNGAVSWGVKSSPPIRSFGLALVKAGQPFYVTDEAELTTWAAQTEPDGSLSHWRLFAEQGGEGVAVDERGNVFIAAGQIYVYSSSGEPLGLIEVPERPLQLVFGGKDRRTLFIPARTSLYSVRTRYPGR